MIVSNVFRAGVLLLLSLSAHAEESLIPLLATDIQQGCGCTFQRLHTQEAPLLSWASEGARKAVVRTTEKIQLLDTRQEKHLPPRDGGPRTGDKLVLFVYNGNWQVQALAENMGSACTGRKKQCSLARYSGKLLIQHEGKARTEVLVTGTCGCE